MSVFPPMFTDSHCHLTFPELASQLPAIRQAMQQAQVERALCICTTMEEFGQVHALALAHGLVFLDEDLAVVGVGGQQLLAVLDDDQVAIPPQLRAGIHHPPRLGRHHGGAGLASDVDALVAAAVELSDHRPLHRPHQTYCTCRRRRG